MVAELTVKTPALDTTQLATAADTAKKYAFDTRVLSRNFVDIMK